MNYKHVDSGSYGLFPQISLLIFVYSIFILFIYVTYRTQSSKQENPSTAVNFLPQYQLAFFNHTFLLPQTTCLQSKYAKLAQNRIRWQCTSGQFSLLVIPQPQKLSFQVCQQRLLRKEKVLRHKCSCMSTPSQNQFLALARFSTRKQKRNLKFASEDIRIAEVYVVLRQMTAYKLLN